MIKKVAILANGGDVSGFNAVIRAIIKTAEHNNVECYGFIDGYNGWLLKEDFKEEQLVNIIRNYCNLNNEQILKLRECAYESWKEKYNAKKNYTTFVDKLQKI